VAVAPRLSVNVNKVATLRNSRGGQIPDVVRAAQACISAGAGGITVHPRADGRHITTQDVRVLNAAFAGLWGERLEFNIEGDPRPDPSGIAPPRSQRERPVSRHRRPITSFPWC